MGGTFGGAEDASLLRAGSPHSKPALVKGLSCPFPGLWQLPGTSAPVGRFVRPCGEGRFLASPPLYPPPLPPCPPPPGPHSPKLLVAGNHQGNDYHEAGAVDPPENDLGKREGR